LIFLFPFTKTKVRLGPKPRKSAGSKWAVASEIAWLLELKDGIL
jgi:hypothetical protein